MIGNQNVIFCFNNYINNELLPFLWSLFTISDNTFLAAVSFSWLDAGFLPVLCLIFSGISYES